MPDHLFAADIHLVCGSSPKNERFLRYLRGLRGLKNLYLLGDLFDYWIGPRHVGSPDYSEAIETLRSLRRQGSRIFFIYGNRDYLVDSTFERVVGCEILGEKVWVELGGKRIFLCHGDFLYNKNPKYSAYRRLMRLSLLRQGYVSIPAFLSDRIARGFKKVSKRTTPAHSWTASELLIGAQKIFHEGADVVICGHIHQPQHHTWAMGNRKCDLYVLGDWDGTGHVVEVTGDRWTFTSPLE